MASTDVTPEYAATLEARKLAAPMRVRCLVPGCAWHLEAAAGDAIREAREHRRVEHRELRLHARKVGRPGKHRWQRDRLDDLAGDERDTIMADRARRARAHGIERDLADA